MKKKKSGWDMKGVCMYWKIKDIMDDNPVTPLVCIILGFVIDYVYVENNDVNRNIFLSNVIFLIVAVLGLISLVASLKLWDGGIYKIICIVLSGCLLLHGVFSIRWKEEPRNTPNTNDFNDTYNYNNSHDNYEDNDNNGNSYGNGYKYSDDNSNKYCSYCGGTGECSKCIGLGDCDVCFGEGTLYCDTCSGSGNCQRCYGQGGELKYVYGGDNKWVECSRCDGTGTCNSCDGYGEKECIYCNGMGICNYCSGTGTCSYCNGSGN